ncbi:Inner spore coat protein D [Oceanobacillus oncorhynchi]|uniref:Inner spore coat protein D n=2 Tax=Oceanobacillus TaxID=182709 RepID=A0A0A1MRN0_9BACI|nr:Inner spore coat protein D [Oceanobacillus oncorhynchi]
MRGSNKHHQGQFNQGWGNQNQQVQGASMNGMNGLNGNCNGMPQQMPMQQMPQQQMQPEYCAPQVSPTQQGPTQVSPTKQYVKTNVSNTEVKHVHPSHTTNVNKHMTTHKHYFPHTESVVNDIKEQHVMCGKPHHPCPPQGPCGC